MNAEDKEDAELTEKHELEDLAETEHAYLRERLREELAREPTEEELNEWLRRHTEGY